MMKRLILIVASALVLASCSDNSHRPSGPAHISDVGEFVRESTIGEVTVATYSYQGVDFEGDMLVEDWEWFSGFLADRLEPDEPLIRVTNYLVYPDPHPSRGVVIESCTTYEDQWCRNGRWWSFGRTLDGWGFREDGTWFIISEPAR